MRLECAVMLSNQVYVEHFKHSLSLSLCNPLASLIICYVTVLKSGRGWNVSNAHFASSPLCSTTHTLPPKEKATQPGELHMWGCSSSSARLWKSAGVTVCIEIPFPPHCKLLGTRPECTDLCFLIRRNGFFEARSGERMCSCPQSW